MLQYTLLFFEIVLLAAIGYIYWRTRMIATNLQALSSQASFAGDQVENQTELMHNMATLITEWEGVADAVRADLNYQQARMGETLEQAEVATTKLQELVRQAETLKGKSSEQQPAIQVMIPGPDPSVSHPVDSTPTTLIEAIKFFSDYLRANHYGQSTITQTINYIQKFAAWLGGQAQVELPLRPIVLAEIELYRRRLEAQHTPTAMVEREVAALKMFANWVNTLDGKICPEIRYPVLPPQPQQLLAGESQDLDHESAEVFLQPTPAICQKPETDSLLTALPSLQSLERYHTVFALAQQGVAPATITAQTGLEREAVRLLLMMGPPSLLKN